MQYPSVEANYGAKCENNSDCKSHFCFNKECACTSDNDCPIGLHCNATSQIYCGEGAYNAYCTKDAECLSGWCDPFYAQCNCRNSSDCPEGENCSNGKCGDDNPENPAADNVFCYIVVGGQAQFSFEYNDEANCKEMCATFDCDPTLVDWDGNPTPCTNWCCLNSDNLNNPPCTAGGSNNGGNVIPGGSAAIPNPLKCGDIPCVVKAIADWITGFVVVLGSIMIIISGIQFITSAGSEEKARRARQTIIYTVIGIAIAVSVDFIIGLLGEVLGRNQ